VFEWRTYDKNIVDAQFAPTFVVMYEKRTKDKANSIYNIYYKIEPASEKTKYSAFAYATPMGCMQFSLVSI
jgi:hypothetical protein